MKKTAFLLVAMLFLATLCFAGEQPEVSFKYNEEYGVIYVTAFGETWIQKRSIGLEIVETEWTDKNTLYLAMKDPSGNQIVANWKLRKNELTCEISSLNNLPVKYPYPFIRLRSDQSDFNLVPVAEGILYPAHDQSIEPYQWLKGNAGYGISLPLFGTVSDSGSGYGFYTDNPEYFEIKANWKDQWVLAPYWAPGKEGFGFRKCHYLFFKEASREQGVVKIAKWYRQYLDQRGWLVKLEKKRASNAKPQSLVAAPHIWVWDDPLLVAEFLKSLGIDRALLANCDPIKSWGVDYQKIMKIREMGYLTGKYVNWEDCWEPNPNLPEDTQTDYANQKNWDQGLAKDSKGKHHEAWTVVGTDGEKHTGAKLCSGYYQNEVKSNLSLYLKKYPLQTLFVDIYTGRELEECYSAEHPQDRIDDRHSKQAILKRAGKQVLIGSEKMTWWGIPVCDYSMGILSLNPYPPADDIGWKPSRILDEVKEGYLQFDVGCQYRVPLFELVAHDCVLPSWYWGDGNNKHPATWREKDLFTVLYGGIPMWCFATLEDMEEYANSLAASYQFVKPALEQIGCAEMVSFGVLNPDRTLQQVHWSNGCVVTANFSEVTQQLMVNGEVVTIPPKDYHLIEAEPESWLTILFKSIF